MNSAVNFWLKAFRKEWSWGIASLLFACCGEDPPPVAPTVTTLQVFDIASNKATVSGQVTSDGGAPILMRGMCWSDSVDPDLYVGDTLTVKPGKGLYLGYLTGLSSGRTYRVRAFAINQVDTAYGRPSSLWRVGVPMAVGLHRPTISTATATQPEKSPVSVGCCATCVSPATRMETV